MGNMKEEENYVYICLNYNFLMSINYNFDVADVFQSSSSVQSNFFSSFKVTKMKNNKIN